MCECVCAVSLILTTCVCIGPTSGGQSNTVTPEDLELHNQAGGAWSVVNGNVYDLEALAAQVKESQKDN